MATNFTNVQLGNNANMPIVGLGTWKSKPGEVTNAVKHAIDVGYRHVDCAYAYNNETEVGEAIQAKIDDGTVQRQDLFITTKLWNTFHAPPDVKPILIKQLNNLKLDFLDLYLIHWPLAFQGGSGPFPKNKDGSMIYADISVVDTWKAMEKCVDDGLCKAIGLSNFNSHQIQDILDNCRIKPAALQVEVHAYLQQRKLFNFCKEKNIAVTAYSPLGSPDRPWAEAANDEPVLMDDPALKPIAEKYKKSPAQILLRFLVQQGFIVIPKSVTPSRIQANLELFDFTLSDEDMATLEALDCNMRYCIPKITVNGKRVPRDDKAPNYPFNAEF